MYVRFLTLISLFCLAIYWFSIRIEPKDILAHEHLIQESTELRTRHALEEKPALQKRLGVQKDIWSQNETLQFKIQSKESLLTIEKSNAVEELRNIYCQSEDGFTLSADEGIYTFPSHQFIAKKNCHLTQDQNIIDGSMIQMDLAQEIVTYENPKGILAEGPIQFSAKKLTWHKKEGKLILTDDVTIIQPDQFTLQSDRGILTLDEYLPKLLCLTDNVQLLSSRIQDKDSFCLADTLTYDPIDKTLLFSAEKKVLFWQEGLHLSASEVLIRENETVEGRGDVHFSFDLEEQNYIDELFKAYL